MRKLQTRVASTTLGSIRCLSVEMRREDAKYFVQGLEEFHDHFADFVKTRGTFRRALRQFPDLAKEAVLRGRTAVELKKQLQALPEDAEQITFDYEVDGDSIKIPKPMEDFPVAKVEEAKTIRVVETLPKLKVDLNDFYETEDELLN
jgi:hypothetical protein